jgi:hypothetical protein
MLTQPEILDEWFRRTLATYGEGTAQLLLSETDPFRNPVGHALRSGLQMALEELFGEMNRERIATALDQILRVRAVQDLTPSEAVGFVFLLREILAEHERAADAALDTRIDQLALAAFDLYLACREQVAAIRQKEGNRTIQQWRQRGAAG